MESRISILVVDDHAPFRRVLCAWLATAFPGASVSEAASARAAVVTALDQRPDLVLMDIGLPDMSGLDATRRICEELPDVEVIVVSVEDSAPFRLDSKKAGALAHVAKAHLPHALDHVLRGIVAAELDTTPANGDQPGTATARSAR